MDRWGWIVPDGLREIAKPLLPPARVRPRGGGVANLDDEAVFAAIIYVLVSGCAWPGVATVLQGVEVDCPSPVRHLVASRGLGTAASQYAPAYARSLTLPM
ncbi:hypothetical protein GCM10010279_05490 [Streptomyces mutabilis]|nr:hypothetical protein GCM10010279_05490 [Streptomyces mutabilis]